MLQPLSSSSNSPLRRTQSECSAPAAPQDGIALGERPAETGILKPVRFPWLAEAAKPGDWDGFQAYMDKETGTKIRPGCSVEPLIDGQTAFPKMLEAIDKAKTSVNWTVFEFDADATGQEVAKHLAAAADRGVKVRLLYDGYGSSDTDGSAVGKKLMKDLRDHKVDIVERNKFLGHITHRKILTVDGETGFIGGMNVGDNYSTIWHDIHSEVKGPAVADLQDLFVTQWKSLNGKISESDQAALYPPLAAVGNTGARIVGHVGSSDTNLKKAYLRAIDTAAESITIADPYVTDEDVYTHLCSAAQRGVDVRLILPKTNDEPAPATIEHNHYGQLLDAGVKVYEYKGRPMAHDKVGVFDHHIATIGSSNLDTMSLWMNDEANVWVDDKDIATRLEAALINDQANSDVVAKSKGAAL